MESGQRVEQRVKDGRLRAAHTHKHTHSHYTDTRRDAAYRAGRPAPACPLPLHVRGPYPGPDAPGPGRIILDKMQEGRMVLTHIMDHGDADPDFASFLYSRYSPPHVCLGSGRAGAWPPGVRPGLGSSGRADGATLVLGKQGNVKV